MKFIKILLLFLFAFTGCEGKKTTKANIFERREVEENKLMIKYAFSANGTSIIDSTIIDNKVLNTDSIGVTYNPSNPAENALQLPK